MGHQPAARLPNARALEPISGTHCAAAAASVNPPNTSTGAATVACFVDALTARDFERLAACLAPAAQARLLLPRGADDVVGRDALCGRLQTWFGSASNFQVVNVGHGQIGARHLASWRFRVVRDGQSWESIEQIAFIDPGPDGIYRIDLLCSGFIREAAGSSGMPQALLGATQ